MSLNPFKSSNKTAFGAVWNTIVFGGKVVAGATTEVTKAYDVDNHSKAKAKGKRVGKEWAEEVLDTKLIRYEKLSKELVMAKVHGKKAKVKELKQELKLIKLQQFEIVSRVKAKEKAEKLAAKATKKLNKEAKKVAKELLKDISL